MRGLNEYYVSFTWLNRSTSTSYGHKNDFQILKSNITARIPLRVIFSNGHHFGPPMSHEV
jgi:hypothetical protein